LASGLILIADPKSNKHQQIAPAERQLVEVKSDYTTALQLGDAQKAIMAARRAELIVENTGIPSGFDGEH
jgi:hypothetical protein